MHLSEDDLVLHYYGDGDPGADRRAADHLAACGACHAQYTRLQRVLALVEAAPVSEPGDGFERKLWARIEPSLPTRRGLFRLFVGSPVRLAWAAGVACLVVAAFLAGRVSRPGDGAAPASEASVRERILLVDLSEHLDRSQIVLVEIATAGDGPTVDISRERARAEELVAANRLYRRTAAESGDPAIAQLLDEIETVLVDVAAAPARVAAEDLDVVRRRIDTRDLLFKLRVLSAQVRDRQTETIKPQKTL